MLKTEIYDIQNLPQELKNLGVGTNNQLVQQSFPEHHYAGPNVDDLLRRAESLTNALRKMITHDHKETSANLRFLINRHDYLKQCLKTHCHIEAEKIKNGDKQYFKELIAKATALIHQYLVDIISTFYKEKIDWKKMMKRLATTESEMILEQGRSNLLHQYTSQNQVRFSTTKTLGIKTPPSTHRETGMLSNFIEQTLYSGDLNNIECQFLRHSSYPPINLFSKEIRSDQSNALRRSMAIEAAEQVMIELTKKAIAKGANPNDVVEVNLNSMILLSPFDGETKIIGKTSNKLQVRETQIALRTFHDREIQLNIKGTTVKVKPKLTQMNMPTNPFGKFYKIPALEKFNTRFNNRGYHEFFDNLNEFFKKNNPLIPENDRNLFEFFFSKFAEDHHLVLLNSKLGTLQQELNIPNQYAELDKIRKKLLAHSDNNPNPWIEKFNDKLSEIKKCEKKVDEIYEKIMEHHRGIFQKHEKFFESLYEINLKNMQLASNNQHDIKHFQILQLFLDAQKIFHCNAFRKDAHGYQFQVRYLLINYLLGQNIEFFCKSGEDRTGRCAEMIEEFIIYRNQFGHFPIFGDEPNLSVRKKIASDVHYYSVNRTVADQNATGARGLQGSSDYAENGWINIAEFDKPIAKMAKNVFGVDSKKVKPKFNPNNMYDFNFRQEQAQISDSIENSLDFFADEDEIEKTKILLDTHEALPSIRSQIVELETDIDTLSTYEKVQKRIKIITHEKPGFLRKLTIEQIELIDKLPKYIRNIDAVLIKIEKSIQENLLELNNHRQLLHPDLKSAAFRQFYVANADDSELLDHKLNKRNEFLEFTSEKIDSLHRKKQHLQNLQKQQIEFKNWWLAKVTSSSFIENFHDLIFLPIEHSSTPNEENKLEASDIQYYKSAINQVLHVFQKTSSELNAELSQFQRDLHFYKNKLLDFEKLSFTKSVSDIQPALAEISATSSTNNLLRKNTDFFQEPYSPEQLPNESKIPRTTKRKLTFQQNADGSLSYEGTHPLKKQKQAISRLAENLRSHYADSPYQAFEITSNSPELIEKTAKELRENGYIPVVRDENGKLREYHSQNSLKDKIQSIQNLISLRL